MPVVELTVNDRAVRVDVPGHWTLIQLLRDGLGLVGTKEGCGEGSCGTCTVLVDARLTRACLALAVRADGARVMTIEGLGTGGALHPIQDAFVRHGAIQCGFCTPGMVMTAKVLLDEHPTPSDREIREFLCGNFCRCAGYNLILKAVRDAAGLDTEQR
ncbi:MAG TPA: (2Fe-2S)-binding protein [Candidatus Methylomirabilis sp.]|nr:(2Fe-2S)-binding protein [Candidatus Methylomirabilis sp.]